MKRGRVLIVEGGIGVGKSTLTQDMKRSPERYFGEGAVVSLAQESIHPDFLSMFLNDKRRMAFPFQLCVARDRLETMREAIRRASRGDVVVLDRGLAGDIAFAMANAEMGSISNEEMSLYFSLLDSGVPRLIPKSLVRGEFRREAFVRSIPEDSAECEYDVSILYLKCPAEVSLERMRKRGNSWEADSYDLGYFQTIEKKHDAVIELFKELPGVSVIEVDYTTLPHMNENGTLNFQQLSDLLKQ